MRFVFALIAPLLMAPLIVTMLMAMHSFQTGYSETLCRMESVRTHAIADVENNRPLQANFGGDECLTPMIPTVQLPLDQLSGAAPAPAVLP
jgi:hypothetical protein